MNSSEAPITPKASSTRQLLSLAAFAAGAVMLVMSVVAILAVCYLDTPASHAGSSYDITGDIMSGNVSAVRVAPIPLATPVYERCGYNRTDWCKLDQDYVLLALYRNGRTAWANLGPDYYLVSKSTAEPAPAELLAAGGHNAALDALYAQAVSEPAALADWDKNVGLVLLPWSALALAGCALALLGQSARPASGPRTGTGDPWPRLPESCP